jgi:hypothetical protein
MHAGKDKPDGLGDQRLRRMLQAWRPPSPSSTLQRELPEGIIEACCVVLYGRTEGKSTAGAHAVAAALAAREQQMLAVAQRQRDARAAAREACRHRFFQAALRTELLLGYLLGTQDRCRRGCWAAQLAADIKEVTQDHQHLLIEAARVSRAAVVTIPPAMSNRGMCLECGAAPPADAVTMRCNICAVPEACPAPAALHCAGCTGPLMQCMQCHDWMTDYMVEEQGLRCEACGDLYCAGCWQNPAVGDVVDDNRFLCRGCRSDDEGT